MRVASGRRIAFRKDASQDHLLSPFRRHGPDARHAPDARLHLLNIEHDDLDDAIAALALSGCADDLTISRLKKRKLHIKDEIAALFAQAS